MPARPQLFAPSTFVTNPAPRSRLSSIVLAAACPRAQSLAPVPFYAAPGRLLVVAPSAAPSNSIPPLPSRDGRTQQPTRRQSSSEKPNTVTNPISGASIIATPPKRRPAVAGRSSSQSPPNPSTPATAKSSQQASPASASYVSPEISVDTLTAVVEALTNNIMKHGKKSVARRIVLEALAYIQTESAVAVAAEREAASDKVAAALDAGKKKLASIPTSIITGMPLGPRVLLAMAIEKAEPLVKLVGFKRGAKSIQTPTPLTERQRRRTAIIWIKEAAEGRNKRDPMGVRIGKEVMAILQGESGVLQKKQQLHKAALLNRSNVVLVDRKVRKMG
ncbi:ribosomal protein S7 domain-containing protein [Zopfochytrium polystomum]|nr:ribosomal protein S7 domain-containing protein [Zopfochytrium polystomum]